MVQIYDKNISSQHTKSDMLILCHYRDLTSKIYDENDGCIDWWDCLFVIWDDWSLRRDRTVPSRMRYRSMLVWYYQVSAYPVYEQIRTYMYLIRYYLAALGSAIDDPGVHMSSKMKTNFEQVAKILWSYPKNIHLWDWNLINMTLVSLRVPYVSLLIQTAVSQAEDRYSFSMILTSCVSHFMPILR